MDETMKEQGQSTIHFKDSKLTCGESPTSEEREDEEMRRSAFSAVWEKMEDIERKKTEVREKIFSQLGRVEKDSKRLVEIQDELETMADPTKMEVAAIRRRIAIVNRKLRPLRQNCLKKEKEYKEVLDAFNEEKEKKGQLVSKLMELVSESGRLKMKKLEELSKAIDSLLNQSLV